ncbi:MAG: TIGR02301 family protein [Pseudomonadota bacterium]
MVRKTLVLPLLAALLVWGPFSAHAQIVPYGPGLNELAETLGSVHYLTNLCADEKTNRWRDEMSDLLATERPDPIRRSRLVASFNRGYRSFASVYVSCTDQARLAADQFLARGAALAAEIENRYVQ